MLKRIATLFLAPILVPAHAAFSQDLQPNASQKAGLYAKPAVVRVVAGCSGTFSYGSIDYPFTVGEVGTGYFINPNGYIITHYRALWPGGEAGCREYLFRHFMERVTGTKNFDSLSEETKIDIRNRSQTAKNVSYFNHVILSTGDVFPFEVEKSGASNSSGVKDVAVIKIQVANAPTLQLGNSGDVKPQTPATLISYPVEESLQSFFSGLTSTDASSNEPLGEAIVVDGRVLNSSTSNGNLTVQLDDSLPLGSLGSPIVNQNGEVTGIITAEETDFTQQSSISTVIPGNAIKPFAREFVGNSQANPTDQLYREGLELLRQGNFQAARAKFRSIRELYPYHSEIYALTNETEQRIAQAQANSNRTLWLLTIGVSVGGLLIAYTIYRLSQYKRGNQPNQISSNRANLASPPLMAQPSTPLDVKLPTPAPEPAKVIPDTLDTDRDLEQRNSQPRQTSVTQISGNPASPATVIGTQPFVELKNQDGRVRRFYLTRDCHRLGRDRAWADLFIPDQGWDVISRCHAVLEREGTDYRIYDGDRKNPSTNGILMDGMSIDTQEGYLLKDGDQVQTGHDPRNQVILTYSNPGNRQSHFPHVHLNSKEVSENNLNKRGA